jgi:dipeptidyl aminopeptidase/acylaminoacyl peptidase
MKTKREIHELFKLNPFISRPLTVLLVTGCALFSVSVLRAQSEAQNREQQRVREPLPLSVVVAVQSPNNRSTFNLSPDGQWLAYTWFTEESMSAGKFFTDTGASLAEGRHYKQAGLVNIKTEQVIKLGGPSSQNWAPVWSPDGSRVAYYSDENGEVGIWIWEKATGKSSRFPGVIPRSFIGFEILRWSPDSRRLLCKVLPEWVTVKEANRSIPDSEDKPRFSDSNPGEPSVLVFQSLQKRSGISKSGGLGEEQKGKSAASGAADAAANLTRGDLAILELNNNSVTRIARRVRPLLWLFSPNQEYVVYVSTLGSEPNSQRSIHEIVLYELKNGISRKLVEKTHLGFGIQLSWSPDSRQIAYISSASQQAGSDITTVSVADGVSKTLNVQKITGFKDVQGDISPLWDQSGRNLYVLGADGKFWRIDPFAGNGAVAGDIPGCRITSIVGRAGRSTLWTTGDGRVAWVVARDRRGAKAGIYRIDLKTGQHSPALEDERSYSTAPNLDANDVTGDIAYIATDQQHLEDAWVFNTLSGKTRQITHLNEGMERYELGTARVIDWTTADGQNLHGALLLPPDYRKGRRLPLVVWVYGGRNGSNEVNRFGFLGSLPQFNFHVLATRGYAVLYPDAPVREGMPMVDLMKVVMPGVDAAIEQGYADPDRLAVMGQSYGSYCTLALITQTTRFKAAVITGAVVHPDLIADYLNIGPEMAVSTGWYYEQGQGGMGGTPWQKREQYLVNSPIFLFDQVETPLLIGQGSRDGNLIPSDATFAALKRLGKDVEYRIYKDEGHVLAGKSHVVDFWQRRLEFLAEHLNLTVDSKGAVIFDGEKARPR